MLIKVIGSSAGGGFPQWNCNGPQSRAVRYGEPGFRSRTQSSLAVSADGTDWVLLNASPDIREQIAATPELQPRRDGPLRHSPIKAVVVTNADIDHIAGLLTLREKEAFSLYASERSLETINANSVFDALDHDLVPRRLLPLDEAVELRGPSGSLGISLEAFAVPGKTPLYLEEAGKSIEDYMSEEGEAIGLRIWQGSVSEGDRPALYYIPGCAWVDEALRDRLQGAGILLFDGTVFTDSEMPDMGLGVKTGHRMGHLPISGEGGVMAQIDGLEIGRRIFIHINNSNPILDENSAARREVEEAGWDVAFDGMELEL
jgi:pyrroloquinoline quinone biosynthesis protein B